MVHLAGMIHIYFKIISICMITLNIDLHAIPVSLYIYIYIYFPSSALKCKICLLVEDLTLYGRIFFHQTTIHNYNDIVVKSTERKKYNSLRIVFSIFKIHSIFEMATKIGRL